jgi:hypothetical protein
MFYLIHSVIIIYLFSFYYEITKIERNKERKKEKLNFFLLLFGSKLNNNNILIIL